MDNTHYTLSKEFKVAAEIYGCNKRGEFISRNALIHNLSDRLSTDDIIQSVDMLLDWGIVKLNIGEQITPCSAKLILVISHESEHMISELYHKHWKDG